MVLEKILKQRPTAKKVIRYEIGNGKILVWYDNWHPTGPLLDKYAAKLIFDSGLGQNARVTQLI